MKKNKLGQFFTKNNSWLTKPIKVFIKQNLKNILVDPFAGEGDLLKTVLLFNKKKINTIGYDIDKDLNWIINDSLIQIPIIDQMFIVTNPPYLSKNSCKRNKYDDIYKIYFKNSKYEDLYLIALEKLIATNCPGIAIVPETFINNIHFIDKINRIVIIESNPFYDTETPVCVVAFNGISVEKCKIYKNNDFIDYYEKLINKTPKIKKYNLVDLKFNDQNGEIGIRGIDSINNNSKISFLKKEHLNYDLSSIKQSSRAITIVSSIKLKSLQNDKLEKLIDKSNQILFNFRKNTSDVLLSPFKGNNKFGIRRRRLDFKLARIILEKAYQSINEKR